VYADAAILATTPMNIPTDNTHKSTSGNTEPAECATD
jgi:hypothetical protein